MRHAKPYTVPVSHGSRAGSRAVRLLCAAGGRRARLKRERHSLKVLDLVRDAADPKSLRPCVAREGAVPEETARMTGNEGLVVRVFAASDAEVIS